MSAESDKKEPENNKSLSPISDASSEQADIDLICPQAPRHPAQEGEIDSTMAFDQEEGEVIEEPAIKESSQVNGGSSSYERVWKGVSPISDYQVKKKIGEGTFG